MKKYIIALLIMLSMGMTSYADVVRSGNTFKIEKSTTSANQDTLTKYTWEDKDGKSYPVYITKKGACYIKRISSKTGKEYKYYLPKEVQEQIRKELGV